MAMSAHIHPKKKTFYYRTRYQKIYKRFWSVLLLLCDLRHLPVRVPAMSLQIGQNGAVPGESIRALWQEFNLCANGWGVEPAFFEQLCGAVARSMGVEPDEKASRAFFSALDTDEVGISNA